MNRKGRSYRGKLSSYTIQDKIGKDSGMGDVYVARNRNQQEVVLKFFKPSPDGNGGYINDDDEFSNRSKLILEAKILKNFLHQNPPSTIIRYMDDAASTNPADFFFVMEKVDGETVYDSIKGNNTMSETKIKNIIGGVLTAIDFLHRHNTTHRDIKPGNIMIKKNGQPVLIDFGTAKQTQNVQSIQEQQTITYTPDWTCHHQTEGHASPQCDIYALGRTMFFMSTRQGPAKYTRGFKMTSTIRKLNPNLSQNFSDLVNEMLDPDHSTLHTADVVSRKLKLIQSKHGKTQQAQNQLASPFQNVQSSPQVSQGARIVLLGREEQISTKSSGSLIGAIHDEQNCSQTGGDTFCNSHGEGNNIFVGDWGCPSGCTCFNPAHITPRHHLRIWNANGQWFIINNSDGYPSAILTSSGWKVMQKRQKHRLTHSDSIALLYVKPEDQIPITLTFYTQ